VTVHELEELGPKLIGLHPTEDTSTGVKLTLAVADVPLWRAVIVALCELEIVPAVA
jgi:hypothetical protein